RTIYTRYFILFDSDNESPNKSSLASAGHHRNYTPISVDGRAKRYKRPRSTSKGSPAANVQLFSHRQGMAPTRPTHPLRRSRHMDTPQIEKDGSYTTSEPNRILAEDIPSVMRQFPSLYELRLDTKTLEFFSSETMRDFQKTPSIQTLMLTRSAHKETSGREIQSATTIGFDLQLLCKKRLDSMERSSGIENSTIYQRGLAGIFKIRWKQFKSSRLHALDTTFLGFSQGLITEFNLWKLYTLTLTELIPTKALSYMDNIQHLGFQFTTIYAGNWPFRIDIMQTPITSITPTPPPVFPVNLRRISIIGYSGTAGRIQSEQACIQRQVSNDIEVRLYRDLKEYKDGVLIPRDYETSSSPKTADYSTMTKLVNQANERFSRHSTAIRTLKAKSQPPANSL
ncbi:14037_t:CDS:2, partial [Acaulospora colombiana]